MSEFITGLLSSMKNKFRILLKKIHHQFQRGKIIKVFHQHGCHTNILNDSLYDLQQYIEVVSKK